MKPTPIMNPNGNDLLLNTQYIPPLYDEDEHGKKVKVEEDYLYMVYRDLDTGDKKLLSVKNPSSDIFVTSVDKRGKNRTQRHYEKEENVTRYNVKYANIAKELKRILVASGEDDDLIQLVGMVPKEVYKWRYAYYSDYNMADYAMVSYLLNNKSYNETELIDTSSVSKAFLDIESDIYGLTTKEAEEGEGPTNAVSVVISSDRKGRLLEHPKVYTFLLRNHERYKQQKYFEAHLDEFIQECHEEFDKDYNQPEFKISLYDDEISLYRHLFAMLHFNSPDFILVWNLSYDAPRIIQRLEMLGEDPLKYFCHPDFERPVAKYNYDMIFRPKNDFKNMSESFTCASYSCWMCQMLNYAGSRKAKSDYGGNSLDNIANLELGKEKRRYSKESITVLNAAVEEYWNFVKYSINDVLLQYGIDKVTEDLSILFEQSLYSGTRISKILKQTIFLYNSFTIEYFKKGIVPGNNMNENYASSKSSEISQDIDLYNSITASGDSSDSVNYDDIQLQGALVGDPTLNGPYGPKILGKKSNRYFRFVIDFDYTAQYPSAISALNIAPQTQVGRVIIKDQIIPNENPDNDPKFMRARLFMEDIESGDIARLSRWFNLPSRADALIGFEEFCNPSRIKIQNGVFMIPSRKDNK